MNPNSNEQSGLNLPAPTFEVQGGLPTDNGPEQPVAKPEFAKQPSQPGFSNGTTGTTAASVANPLSVPLSDNTDTNSSGPGLTTTPAVAGDTDLIEKEWVSKAKQIVEKTREDPYVQTKEMNRFKADYIKKRYGKDLKISDE